MKARFVLALLALLVAQTTLRAADPTRTFSIVTDPLPGRATQHGIGELTAAIRARGWTVDVVNSASAATGSRQIIASTNAASGLTVPESLKISHLPQASGPPILSLQGADYPSTLTGATRWMLDSLANKEQ